MPKTTGVIIAPQQSGLRSASLNAKAAFGSPPRDLVVDPANAVPESVVLVMNSRSADQCEGQRKRSRNMFILLRAEILLWSESTGIEYPPKKTIVPCMTVFTAINSRA